MRAYNGDQKLKDQRQNNTEHNSTQPNSTQRPNKTPPMTKKQQSEIIRQHYRKIGSAGGKKSSGNMTNEQRTERARKAVAARWKNKREAETENRETEKREAETENRETET